MPEPKFQDRVKHKTSAIPVTGVVIAKYLGNFAALVDRDKCWKDKMYLDVRGDDNKIYWATPAENWETISTEEERFE